MKLFFPYSVSNASLNELFKTVPKIKKKKSATDPSTVRYDKELVRCELQGSNRKTTPKREHLKSLICKEGWDCLKIARTKLLWIAFYRFMYQISAYL